MRADFDANDVMREYEDPGVIRELIEIMTADLPEYVAALAAAGAAEDLDAVGRAAHRIKGAASNFSAAPVCELAGTIEQLSRAGQAEVFALVPQLEAACASLAAALTAWHGALGAADAPR